MLKDRILKLADYMERLDPKLYDQNRWVDGPPGVKVAPGEQIDEDFRLAVIPEGACGTTMCVLGHGVRAVPEAGLTWIAYLDELGDGPRPLADRSLLINVGVIRDGTVDATDYEAGMIAFGLNYDQAKCLFGSASEDATQLFYLGITTMREAMRWRRQSSEERERLFNARVTPVSVAETLRKAVRTGGGAITRAITLADKLWDC